MAMTFLNWIYFYTPPPKNLFRSSSLAFRRKPLIGEGRNLRHAHENEAASHRLVAAIAPVGESAIALDEFPGVSCLDRIRQRLKRLRHRGDVCDGNPFIKQGRLRKAHLELTNFVSRQVPICGFASEP